VADELAAASKAEGEKERAEARVAANNVLALDAGNTEATVLLERVEKSLRAQHAGKDVLWTNSLGMEFVPAGGTTVMWCVWHTRVKDFKAFVDATGYDATAAMCSLHRGEWKQQGDTWKSPGFSQGPTHPVCGVSWVDAKAFCRWLTEKERKEGWLGPEQSYRLPADAEWSVAVGLNEESGGRPRDKSEKVAGVYPWGSEWPPPSGAGNYAGSEAADADWNPSWKTIEGYKDGYARTSPVGSFGANRFGLYDIGGNLWQWCEDFYQSQSHHRVLRGGSWCNYHPYFLLSSYRGRDAPDTRGSFIGFRVVLAGGSSR
jgi:formylglycine-generating enzyme required for sulfatase activity